MVHMHASIIVDVHFIPVTSNCYYDEDDGGHKTNDNTCYDGVLDDIIF